MTEKLCRSWNNCICQIKG